MDEPGNRNVASNQSPPPRTAPERFTRAFSTAINAVFCFFVVSTAAAETFLSDVDTGQFVRLRGKVIQSIQSEDNFLLRVNITPGNYEDTIVVTYRAVSPLQVRIPQETLVDFQGWYRGKTSYKTTLGATLELPLVNACLLWDANDSLRFAPPKGCGW